MVSFPVEILEIVVNCVAESDPDNETLLRCCSCSKSLLTLAQPFLFSTIRLWLLELGSSRKADGNLLNFLHSIQDSDLGKHVTRLAIEGYALQSAELAQILPRLPNVRVLRLSSSGTVRPVIWDSIPPPNQDALVSCLLPHVREVWLENLVQWPFLTFGLACPNITRLYFNQIGVKEVIDDPAMALLETSESITQSKIDVLELTNFTHSNVRPWSSFFKFLEYSHCSIHTLSLTKSHDFAVLATLETLLPIIGSTLKELSLDSEFVYMLIFRWNDAWPHRVDLSTGLFDFSSLPSLETLNLDIPIYGTRQSLLTLTPFFSVLADMIGSSSEPHYLEYIIVNIPTMEGVSSQVYEEDEAQLEQWKRLDFLLSDMEKLPKFEAIVFNFSPTIADVDRHREFLADSLVRCEMMEKMGISRKQGWKPGSRIGYDF